jgi:hypothetical protein
VFKRVIGVLFYSYCDRDSTNPNWSILDYDPTKSIAKGLTTEEEKRFKTLKHLVRNKIAEIVFNRFIIVLTVFLL